ncbi:hypothetical protein LGQ02_17525 [Bacillus shivajii]|uniref:cytochrome bd oxidase small subunit CydS n=1 Tax=Bacillus shivajii TaxID=1983719 RepID=UPI001CFAF59A|nr:hypothetical protein [Bacillus shivajii]UCZ52591.1 hypothetical protein LGQ02_17525 [Bacillus shivajii]
MDSHTFFITLAPVLVLFASIIFVFVWGAKAKPPAFVTEERQDDHRRKNKDGAS